MEKRSCAVCGADLSAWQKRFCSRACYGQTQQKQVPVSCHECGAAFTLRRYRALRAVRHYCADCRATQPRWATGKPRSRPLTLIMLPCFWCGTPCYRQPHYTRRAFYTFCSGECRTAGWGSVRRAHDLLKGGDTE